MTNDLEFLREAFRDTRLHVGIGTVVKTGLSLDASRLRALVNLLPENREVVAECAWNDPGMISFPQPNDLVLVVFVDGDADGAYVVKQLTNADDPIPTFAQDGSMTVYSRAGSKLWLGSDTQVGIGRPNVATPSALVLGDVLVNGLTALANAFLNAAQVGQSAMGPVALDATVRTALSNFVSTYLTTTSTNILSQIAYTERGV